MAIKSKAERVNEKTGRETRLVFVRCVAVHTYANGVAGIELPVKPIHSDDLETLRALFPNLIDKVHDLLEREALIAAMSTGDVDFNGAKHVTHSTTLDMVRSSGENRSAPAGAGQYHVGDDDEVP